MDRPDISELTDRDLLEGIFNVVVASAGLLASRGDRALESAFREILGLSVLKAMKAEDAYKQSLAKILGDLESSNQPKGGEK